MKETYHSKNLSLQKFNSFGINITARDFFCVKTIDSFISLTQQSSFQQSKKFFLGGGSNILLTNDFDGVVIKNDILHREIINEDEESITLKLGAGENRHSTVMRSCTKNRAGIENLVLIPGSVGGGAIQNIGAYGMEIKDVIVSVEGIDLKGNQHTYLNKECQFSYRSSIFKKELQQEFFVTHITIKLRKLSHPILSKTDYHTNLTYAGVQDQLNIMGINSSNMTLSHIAQAIITIRQSKLPDPKTLGTAGSFFENPVIDKKHFDILKKRYDYLKSYPVKDEKGNSIHDKIKLPAGQLIEHCGLKGYRDGNVGTYEKHALALVNYGGGTGEDLLALAKFIQEKVYEKYQIQLIPEVKIIS